MDHRRGDGPEDTVQGGPLDRRAFLAAAAAAGVGTAGCLGVDAPRSAETPPSGTPTITDSPLATHGFPADICSEEPVRNTFDAIDEPAFADDWSGIDVPDQYTPLADDDVVIGLRPERIAQLADETPRGASRPRAYPITVLWQHEIVNDVVGVPLLVTYCSLCKSGMVADRRVDGAATRFRVSGLLWRPPSLYEKAAESGDDVFAVDLKDPDPEGGLRGAGNLVMVDDATRSLWSQLLLRGICGPERGSTLSPLPATATTWRDWRSDHPDTEVLLPAPYSGTAPEPGT